MVAAIIVLTITVIYLAVRLYLGNKVAAPEIVSDAIVGDTSPMLSETHLLKRELMLERGHRTKLIDLAKRREEYFLGIAVDFESGLLNLLEQVDELGQDPDWELPEYWGTWLEDSPSYEARVVQIREEN